MQWNWLLRFLHKNYIFTTNIIKDHESCIYQIIKNQVAYLESLSNLGLQIYWFSQPKILSTILFWSPSFFSEWAPSWFQWETFEMEEQIKENSFLSFFTVSHENSLFFLLFSFLPKMCLLFWVCQNDYLLKTSHWIE